jgi:hypothetical protein
MKGEVVALSSEHAGQRCLCLLGNLPSVTGYTVRIVSIESPDNLYAVVLTSTLK